MTANDMGFKIKAGFAHHPSIEEQIKEKEINKVNSENYTNIKSYNSQVLSE